MSVNASRHEEVAHNACALSCRRDAILCDRESLRHGRVRSWPFATYCAADATSVATEGIAEVVEQPPFEGTTLVTPRYRSGGGRLARFGR